LIIPGILVNGYLLRVVQAGVAGDEDPPEFRDWLELLLDGIIVWIIEAVYIFVPAALLMFGIGSFAVAAGLSSSAGAGSMASPDGGLIGGLTGLLLLLIPVTAGFLMPAGLANYARTGEVTKAFDLRTVIAVALSANYLVAIISIIAVSIVLGLIGGVLVLLLVGVFVLFYQQIVGYYLFGTGFVRGLNAGSVAATSTEPAG
jgi:uncharacterized membrane protein